MISPCPGCGVVLPDTDGPTHAYIGASPACWARYGELLVREFGELRNPAIHRVSVDTYAVQHPGVPERRSIQSVAALAAPPDEHAERVREWAVDVWATWQVHHPTVHAWLDSYL